MINLYYSFYYSNSKERMDELNFCLLKNLKNKYIDKIYIMINKSDLEYFTFDDEKIIIIEIEDRPTFQITIDLVNKYTTNDDINIIINSDCYIEESNSELLHKIKFDEMWCMNKYQIIDENFNFKFHDQSCSQDCWIFKGPTKNINNVNFNFGVPGCDNRFAYESKRAGYKLKNPSLEIKILHYHLSNVRTCPPSEWEKYRVRGNYEFVEPEKF